MLDEQTHAILQRFLFIVEDRQQFTVSEIMTQQTEVKNFLQLLHLQMTFMTNPKDENTQKMISMLEMTRRQLDLMEVVIRDFIQASQPLKTLVKHNEEVQP